MGSIDANGVFQYDETDNEPTFSDLMGLLTVPLSAKVADLVGDIAANMTALGNLGVYQTYSPTMGNVTLGTGGTATGRYTQIGKQVVFEVVCTLGTGGAATGSISTTLPTSIRTTENMPIADAWLYDSSAGMTAAGIEVWKLYRGSSTQGIVRSYDGTASGASSPWTWAVGDKIVIRGSYEAA